MFRIIPPSQFVTTRWKNGGGLTHEIARDREGDDWHWRLSIADVASDGPFSVFKGYARILTVIEGAGLALHTPEGTLHALPLQPVAFSGDVAIDSRLVRGVVRDFNVIHDPFCVAAEVAVITGPVTVDAGPGLAGLLCLMGDVAVMGTPVAPGACALGTLGSIRLAEGAMAIVVTLAPVQTEATSPATA